MAAPAQPDYHWIMQAIHKQVCTAHQRLALLKQRERELQIEFSQSHASLADTAALEAELVAVAEEIVDLELTLALVALPTSA